MSRQKGQAQQETKETKGPIKSQRKRKMDKEKVKEKGKATWKDTETKKGK